MDLESTFITCPYCSESIALEFEATTGRSEYIEDCQVCCRPITIIVSMQGKRCRVQVKREDE